MKIQGIIAGLGLTALGIYYLTKPPEHYDDNSNYVVTYKNRGTVVSQSETTGKWLNENEPHVVKVARICGLVFILMGTGITYIAYRDKSKK